MKKMNRSLDSETIDAFTRIRISSPGPLFDSDSYPNHIEISEKKNLKSIFEQQIDRAIENIRKRLLDL